MSLILDALRKADAERDRGSVPNLGSHPVVPLSAETPAQPATRQHWLWIAMGIAVGLVGAVTWMTVWRNAPPPAVATRVDSVPPAATAGGATPPAAPVPPAAPSAAAMDAPAVVAAPAPWPNPDERKSDERKPARADPAPAARLPVTEVPVLEAPVTSREQLPPHIRAELPQFAIGGSIYSSNRASRSLIVNGQLYRERDRLTPDLTLDEIRPKAAIFSFRGHRFEVAF